MLKIFKKHSNKILWISIFIYILLFSFLSLKKYYAFGYNAFDLAIFNQVFFNTLDGRWFEMTINLNSYLADHFTPIIILLLPVYKLWPRAETLLILQSIVLGLSAWPLYKISRHVKKNSLFALSIALLWLVNPFVHNANVFEFHLLPLAVFFIFWTFYFYQKDSYKLFILFLVLSLLVREDIALILVGFFPLAFFEKRNLKWKIISIILPVVYFLFSISLVSSFSGGAYKFVIYYSWLTNIFSQPISVLAKIFSLSNIFNFSFVFLPLLFIPFLRARYLFLSLLPLLQFVLSSTGFYSVIYNSHYILLLLPGIFISFIFAFSRIDKQKIIYNNKNFFNLIFLFTVIYFLIFSSPIKNFFNNTISKDHIKEKFITYIDKGASLVTDLSIASQLSNRQEIYPLHYTYFAKGQFGNKDFNLPSVDYILIDYSNFFDILVDLESRPERSIDNPASNFRNILANYYLVEARNNMFLFSAQAGKNNYPLYELGPESSASVGDNLVDDYKLEKKDNLNTLKINFKKTHSDNKYLVRFYKDDSYFDLPLDYGLWPMDEWPEDYPISFYYYLSDNVNSWQIFSWQGDNKLGYIRELAVDMDVSPITSVILLNN